MYSLLRSDSSSYIVFLKRLDFLHCGHSSVHTFTKKSFNTTCIQTEGLQLSLTDRMLKDFWGFFMWYWAGVFTIHSGHWLTNY